MGCGRGNWRVPLGQSARYPSLSSSTWVNFLGSIPFHHVEHQLAHLSVQDGGWQGFKGMAHYLVTISLHMQSPIGGGGLRRMNLCYLVAPYSKSTEHMSYL